MMNKHTAGPWKFAQENIDPEWYIVTAGSGAATYIVANVNSGGNQVANSALIAAAPALLEALRGYVNHSGSVHSRYIAGMEAIAAAEGTVTE